VSDDSKSTEHKPASEESSKHSPARDNSDKGAKRAERRESRKEAGAKVKKGANAIRSRIGAVVWLIAVVCALFLAIGALLIALDANRDNSIVTFVLSGADTLDGPFSRDNGLFTFDGRNAETKSALVNWGLAAVAYLIVGKILDRIIRP
jgi:hypothetical protein